MKKQQKISTQYWVKGIGLIGFGVLIFLQKNGVVPQFANPLIFLPLLAAWFIGLGIISKEAALFIPGGVLTGISFGLLLSDSVLAPYAANEDGVFMLGFSVGWVGISVLTAVFNQKRVLWPLIPAGIIGLIGLIISVGGHGLALFGELLEHSWMLTLILLGIYLIWDKNGKTDQATKA